MRLYYEVLRPWELKVERPIAEFHPVAVYRLRVSGTAASLSNICDRFYRTEISRFYHSDAEIEAVV